MKSKIYISVLGGAISTVLSTNKNIDIEIWDWDNIECEHPLEVVEALQQDWNSLCDSMHMLV